MCGYFSLFTTKPKASINLYGAEKVGICSADSDTENKNGDQGSDSGASHQYLFFFF